MNAHKVAAEFSLSGAIVSVEPFGDGLINSTFVICTDAQLCRRYILQRVNQTVFSKPKLLMSNLRYVLTHLNNRINEHAGTNCCFPKLIKTRDGEDYYVDADGELWRTYEFMEHTRSYNILQNEHQAAQLGKILGQFHSLLSDIDMSHLTNTLPGFHILPGYIEQFNQAVLNPVEVSRVNESADCIDIIRHNEANANCLELAKAKLGLRVVHGDPKLNNVLFSEDDQSAVSLIDLDTVNPGLIQCDLGDCIRSSCNLNGETAESLSDIRFEIDMCEIILCNYFSVTHRWLSAIDYDVTLDAIRLLPFELGLRFFTDYLRGDQYFAISHAEENLHRARVQFALLRSIDCQLESIERLISSLKRRYSQG